MPNQPIHLAFLGCGAVTRKHSKTLSGMRDRVRCSYASRDQAKAESYKRTHQGVSAFGSYHAAMHAEDVDAVLVATPPAQHLELTLQALEAGKHVIVEKPPLLKSHDFDSVQQAAQKAGRQVLVAENYYYKPLLVRLRALIREDIIGEILFLHINALKQQRVDDWRGDAELAGGGALFEGGIHWINFLNNMGLELAEVRGFRPGDRQGIEKSMLVSLRYTNGAVGSFYYSWEIPSLFQGLRLSKIYGREGSITFESNGLLVFIRGRSKKLIFPGFKDISGYKGMFVDFIAALQNERNPEFTLALAKKDVETIEKVYETC